MQANSMIQGFLELILLEKGGREKLLENLPVETIENLRQIKCSLAASSVCIYIDNLLESMANMIKSIPDFI